MRCGTRAATNRPRPIFKRASTPAIEHQASRPERRYGAMLERKLLDRASSVSHSAGSAAAWRRADVPRPRRGGARGGGAPPPPPPSAAPATTTAKAPATTTTTKAPATTTTTKAPATTTTTKAPATTTTTKAPATTTTTKAPAYRSEHHRAACDTRPDSSVRRGCGGQSGGLLGAVWRGRLHERRRPRRLERAVSADSSASSTTSPASVDHSSSRPTLRLRSRDRPTTCNEQSATRESSSAPRPVGSRSGSGSAPGATGTTGRRGRNGSTTPGGPRSSFPT